MLANEKRLFNAESILAAVAGATRTETNPANSCRSARVMAERGLPPEKSKKRSRSCR